MSRLVTLGSFVAAFLAVWTVATVSEQVVFPKRCRMAPCEKVYALQMELPEAYRSVVQLLPLWALVSFGLYSLSVIGWSLAYFPTCPKDAETLQGEMKEAQEELCARGILRKNEFSTQKD